MTKPQPWTPETVALVRMAVLTILAHGVRVSSFSDGLKAVYVRWDQLLVLMEATGAAPEMQASEAVKGCVTLTIHLDGIAYSTACWRDELKHFGIEVPADKEGALIGG